MKTSPDYQQDIASIRSVMERSLKFLSLSGLSGILAGIYALIGASIAYYILYYPNYPFGFQFNFINEQSTIIKISGLAIVVLLLSLGTAYAFSLRKAKKSGASLWSASSKQLQINMLISLLSGGLFIIILIFNAYFALVAPAFLIFYGLALIYASPYTFNEVRYLGFTEVCIGLLAATLPGYGLIFWALGFGLMHIIYGAIMYYRHDQ